MNQETDIMQRVRLAVGALPGVRVFRNNVGAAWLGEVVDHEPGRRVILLNPRRVNYGLCPGSADLIGWSGGRFVALEVKSPIGQPTEQQTRFLETVRGAGGIAAVVRSPEEARHAIDNG